MTGQLPALLSLGGRSLLAGAAEQEHGRYAKQDNGDDGDDDPLVPAPPGERLLVHHDVVERIPAPLARLEIHRFHRPQSGCTATGRLSVAVLPKYITWNKPK